MHVVCVQVGAVPYLVAVVLRTVLPDYSLLIETIILLVNPLFGVFIGLGYIMEVYCSVSSL